MQVGISTAVLFPECSTEEAIGVLKNSGASVIEVFYSTFYEYRPEFSKTLVDATKGLIVNSVHTYSSNFEPNLFNPSRRVRGDGFYWLDQLGRSAQLIGAKNYTFHGFHRLKAGGMDNFDNIGNNLRDAVDFMSGYGINLCLENVSWCTYNRPGFFTEMKRRCPNLMGVFDIKQARRSGYPWQMYVKDMAGSIAYAHLSDIDADGRMCLPGFGIYDFNEILKRLQDVGFDGNLLIEVYGSDYEDKADLTRSLDFLREVVDKIV